MPKKVIQIAMEDGLVEALDQLSGAKGRSRAEIIRDACRRYVKGLNRRSWTAPTRRLYAPSGGSCLGLGPGFTSR